MRVLVSVLVVASYSLAACGGGSAGLNQTSVTCPPGRTLLDGTCVSEQVADYVACVRAQGAQLGAAKSQQISAEAGYLGVKAGGASDVSENLQRKYSASDETMMAIVNACNSRAGFTNTVASKNTDHVAPPSTSTLANPCECRTWSTIEQYVVLDKKGQLVCRGGQNCARHFALQGNVCADPGDFEGRSWCYVADKACADANVSKIPGLFWRWCTPP